MAGDFVSFEVVAQTDQFVRAFTKTIPAAANQGAQEVATIWGRAARKMQDITGVSVRDMGKKFGEAGKRLQQSQLVSEAETISALFIQMGGNVSRVASVFTSLIRPVSIVNEAFGAGALKVAALGVGIGASAIGAMAMASAVASLGGALIQAGNDAVDAAERLEKYGLLTDEQVLLTRQLDLGAQALKIAQDRLTVAIAENVGQVQEANLAYAGFGIVTRNAAAGALELRANILEMSHSAAASIPVVGGLADNIFRFMGPETNIGLNPLVNLAIAKLADYAREATIEVDKTTLAVQDLLDPKKNAKSGVVHQDIKLDANYILGGGDMERQAKEDEKRGREAQRRADQAAAAERVRLNKIAAAREQLSRLTEQATIRSLDDEAKIQAEYEARVRAIQDISTEAKDQAATDAALKAAEAERIEKLRELEEKRKKAAEVAAAKAIADAQTYRNEINSVISGLRAVGEAVERAGKTTFGNLNTQSTNLLRALGIDEEGYDQIAAWGDAVVNMATATFDTVMALRQQELDAELDALAKREDRTERLTDRQKQLREDLKNANTAAQRAEIQADLDANKAKINNARNAETMARNEAIKTWRVNQKLQIAQVAINSAAAFGMALATTPVPFPASLGIAGLAAGAVASQAIVIASQKPPKFARGGVVGSHMPGTDPDSAVIQAERGEGVVSRRGMSELGKEGLDAINNGAGGRPIEVHMHLNIDGREFARIVERYGPDGSKMRAMRNLHGNR